MEKTKNPIIERQIYWIKKVDNNSFIDFINGKPKPFLELGKIFSAVSTSDEKLIWFDFVDGILGLFSKGRFFESQKTIQELEDLTSKGFKIILDTLRNAEFQKGIINKFQPGTEIITFLESNRAIVNSESLSNFRNTINKFILTEESVEELRKEYIEKKIKDYDFLLLSKSSSKNHRPKKEEITATQAGYMLYFLMGKHPDFKICTSRDHLGIKENLKKLGIKEMSANTVYQKGIRILSKSQKYKDLINPIDVAVIIPKLNKLDPKIADTAKNEFFYLIHGRE